MQTGGGEEEGEKSTRPKFLGVSWLRLAFPVFLEGISYRFREIVKEAHIGSNLNVYRIASNFRLVEGAFDESWPILSNYREISRRASRLQLTVNFQRGPRSRDFVIK